MFASLALPRLETIPADRSMSEIDTALMHRVARGDHAAYRLLVDKYLRHAVTVAYRVLYSRGDAEEVAQEAFLRVWQHAARWRADGGASFKTWLNRVVVNLCIDRKRKPGMAALDDQVEIADEDHATPYDTRLAVETSDHVALALQKLPERQRAAILLCFWEGESNIDAARALDISIGALESLLIRAKRALRDDLRTTFGPKE
ncbi:sigma-70 family RNA polymerase sigma factor [Ferrovibrio terrae]|uniref:Sigma-70 family RNA polymerase sigma factor n=1 Tax=Ferrovibrio terrae TaxID=2594003 RepID=A0A516H646_9PROT|nr:sigma-70 family RNA polymerase sigma factor [Ferrovibrio terrae]QDO99181.1 sigma-70 family RNA polymerase sigma factor [Ferrovibrio terrae]